MKYMLKITNLKGNLLTIVESCGVPTLTDYVVVMGSYYKICRIVWEMVPSTHQWVNIEVMP